MNKPYGFVLSGNALKEIETQLGSHIVKNPDGTISLDNVRVGDEKAIEAWQAEQAKTHGDDTRKTT